MQELESNGSYRVQVKAGNGACLMESFFHMMLL